MTQRLPASFRIALFSLALAQPSAEGEQRVVESSRDVPIVGDADIVIAGGSSGAVAIRAD